MSARLPVPLLRVTLALLLPVAALPLRASAAPVAADEQEQRVFRDTAERYAQRMGEFQGDVREIVDAAEAEERARISDSFGAAMARNEEDGNTLRRVTIAKLESFLQKYPDTRYAPDMKFRLADLYYDEAELDFVARMQEYAVLQDQADANPSMVLPEPPEKDYRKPIALYVDILRNYPDFAYRPDSLYMLGWCYGSGNAAQHNDEAARDAYVEIVTRFPKSAFANDANMHLGEYYFDLPGIPGDPTVNVRTAVMYYNAVMADGTEGRNYDKAMYKLGWSHYKMNEYDKALAYLVQLLDYSDTLYARTGSIAQTRKEAVEYLAISYADLADRQGKSPVEVARAHLSKVGDRKWQHDVVERLADILLLQAKFEDSIDTYAFLQKQWPLDPKNPIYQYSISTIYAKKMPVRNDAAAAEALTVLSKNYVEGTPWYGANKSNPDAIAQARGYIESSLATVASDKLVRCQEAIAAGDPTAQALCHDAAVTFRDFLQKYPFAADYDQDEWYEALAWFLAGDFPEAATQYAQVLKNPRSKFHDGARFQLMKAREQIVKAKYGKIDVVPEGALVNKSVTTPYGKQIVQYMITDEQKAFVLSADDIQDREFTDPDWIPLLEKVRPALAYNAGLISYRFGDLPDARKRLLAVYTRYPATDQSRNAAALLVQTYVDEGDIASVEQWAKKLGLTDIAEEAALTLCQALIDAGKHGDAAVCLAKFRQDYPGPDKYTKVAHYKYANQLDLAGRTAEANTLFEQYINDYSDDENAKGLYFRIAQGYSSILDLKTAIKYFDKLVDVTKGQHPDAPAALYNSAFLRTGTGDHEGAARKYEEYAKLPAAGTSGEIEKIFWLAGEQWELVSPVQAISFYERYLGHPSHFASINPSHAIIAEYKLSQLYLARGDKARSAKKLEELDQTFRENAAAGVSSDARKLAALRPTQELLAELDDFKKYAFGKSKKDEKANVELVRFKKPEALRKLVDDSLALIQTYQDFDAAAAALYVQGAAYFAYADMIYKVPPPAGLTEEEMGIYQEELDRVLSPLRLAAEDAAKARLQASLEKARVDKHWSVWNSKAVELLHDFSPSEYPSERQEGRGVIDGSPIQFADPASPVPPAAPATGGAK